MQNSKIESDQCKGCECVAKPVAFNNSDPDLVLYGCEGHKCRHTLIRMKFIPQLDEPQIPITAMDDLQVSAIV
jgi:hypothetical protein